MPKKSEVRLLKVCCALLVPKLLRCDVPWTVLHLADFRPSRWRKVERSEHCENVTVLRVFSSCETLLARPISCPRSAGCSAFLILSWPNVMLL